MKGEEEEEEEEVVVVVVVVGMVGPLTAWRLSRMGSVEPLWPHRASGAHT